MRLLEFSVMFPVRVFEGLALTNFKFWRLLFRLVLPFRKKNIARSEPTSLGKNGDHVSKT